MENSWDDYASDWDDNKDARLYADSVFKTLTDFTRVQGLRVLDFGCGTGLLTEKLSPLAFEIVSLDPSPKMISVLDQKKLSNVSTLAVQLSENSINRTRLLQTRFDLIVASSVCSFLPDYEGTLVLLDSLLSKDGVFVQWDWLAPDLHSDFGLSESRVESALKKAGFKEIKINNPFCLSDVNGAKPVLMGAARKTVSGL